MLIFYFVFYLAFSKSIWQKKSSRRPSSSCEVCWRIQSSHLHRVQPGLREPRRCVDLSCLLVQTPATGIASPTDGGSQRTVLQKIHKCRKNFPSDSKNMGISTTRWTSAAILELLVREWPHFWTKKVQEVYKERLSHTFSIPIPMIFHHVVLEISGIIWRKFFYIIILMISNNWNSRTFRTLWHQIPKLLRPSLVFKYFPGPGKRGIFSRNFKNNIIIIIIVSMLRNGL